MTGYPRDVGKQVEIVDTNGQPKTCTAVQNYPTEVSSAMGGVLNKASLSSVVEQPQEVLVVPQTIAKDCQTVANGHFLEEA